jgi:ACS family hexuronate transporter-like MFS transporter
MRRGLGNNRARKLALLACAFMVLPIVLAPRVSSPWLATGLISLAMAGHCGWAANIFTIPSDIFPKRTVSSVVGICGFGGASGGMLVSSAIGFVLQTTGSYLGIFALASFSYLLGVSLVHLMSPRLDPVNLER